MFWNTTIPLRRPLVHFYDWLAKKNLLGVSEMLSKTRGVSTVLEHLRGTREQQTRASQLGLREKIQGFWEVGVAWGGLRGLYTTPMGQVSAIFHQAQLGLEKVWMRRKVVCHGMKPEF